MDPFYGGLIWTKHALSRAQNRNLTQSEIFDAIRHPSTSSQGTVNGSIKYTQVNSEKMIEVIVKKNEKGQRVIMSCWSKSKSRFRPKIPLWESVIRWFVRIVLNKH